MSGLRLIESNRLEVLSEALAVTLSSPLSSPLTPEIIVVQSRGMQRWLSMELARMHGVCTNVKWPFPNAFVLDMFSRILPGVAQPALFEKDALTLRIMDCLPGLLGLDSFGRVRDYLRGDTAGMKLYQFSAMMANIYDQYVIFRPELVLGWEEGGGRARTCPEEWQAILWNRIIEGNDAHHRARLRQLFRQGLASADMSKLLERVSIFGISYLPAFHLDVLKGLSEMTDVSLYCLNPCREYWADIVPERHITRAAGRKKGEDLHMESRNELLAGMGRLGRNFLDMVIDLDPEQVDLFEDSEGSTMLAQIQGAILNLREFCEDGMIEVDPGDRSIQVHSCHSPMREVEVLLDTLLDLFEKDSRLEPKDVLVMAPDIESYAPFIRAVFDMDRGDTRRIPYSISDRSFRRSSQLADALMAVLDLPGRRYEASLVMDLLEREPVKVRFGLDEEAVRKIHSWVALANIRWGRDGREKEEMGLPGFEENTWEFGLKRILLGYAMAGDGLFSDIAPLGDMDPAWAEVLGGFVDFVERLFEAVENLRLERGPGEWSEVLVEIIEGLFAVDDDGVQEMLRLTAAVRGLERIGQAAGFTGTLSVDVVRQHLARAFGSAAEGGGFLDRGITFCSMLPMRSIPFKAICLLGMNHEAFPRRDYLSGLDLMAMKPRKGDRSRREDDLYLFLEALLSARDVLVISYIGQGVQDNAAIPPSVVVSSLLEYLDRAFTSADGKLSEAVVVKHCLQAFNPRYFLPGTGLFSYSKNNALAARALQAGPKTERERAVLDGFSDEKWLVVEMERLLEFFRGPARFFLKHRLGVMLPREEEAVLDREPLTLSGLDRYSLLQRVLHERLAGKGVETYLARFRAEGVLPHGVPGELTLKGLAHEIDSYLPFITRSMAGRTFEKAGLEVIVDRFTVKGIVESLDGTGFLSFRYAKTAPSDLLRAWVSMLLLQAAHPGGKVGGMHIHKEGIVRFASVADPLAVLKGLLDVYWQGLLRPVHFFPRSSYAYAESRLKYASNERAMQDARKQWEGSWDLGGESGDAASHLCYAGSDPLDGEFRDLAMAVFVPLLESMEAK